MFVFFDIKQALNLDSVLHVHNPLLEQIGINQFIFKYKDLELQAEHREFVVVEGSSPLILVKFHKDLCLVVYCLFIYYVNVVVSCELHLA